MTYALLGHSLHELADRAKEYFADKYGATKFICEKAIDEELPLCPTWQATLRGGYKLCVEVHDRPFSPSLYEFVTKCANSGMPVRLWVATPASASPTSFAKDLKEARALGVGVLQLSEDGTAGPHEFHKPVALSLFGLRKTNLANVRKAHREAIKKAEDAFLEGSPEQACQLICQDLEAVSRKFGQYTYEKNWWKPKPKYKARFFTTDPWANMLEMLGKHIDLGKMKKKCPPFRKGLVSGTSSYTDWRNSLSHKSRTLKELQARDARLRTMFEATRDHLLEWWTVLDKLKLKVD